MNNTMLIGLSHQLALERAMEVAANNVANVTTTGFKSRSAEFREYLMPGARVEAARPSDRRLSYVVDAETPLDLSVGQIERTGNPLDVALRDENAFFAVQTSGGERYTRNGAFQLNAAGDLVTSDGYAVLGTAGPMRFAKDTREISIGTDGTISTEQGPSGKLRLVQFADPERLVSAGSNLYRSSTPPRGAPAARLEVGALERSNVNPFTELMQVSDIAGAYQTAAARITALHDLMRTAIRRLADTTA